jgi:hypothetical protein
MKSLSLIAAILAFVFRVTAQDILSVTRADVTEVGIYTGRVVHTNEVPGGFDGIMYDLDSATLLQATTNVPSRIGTRFGFRYSIYGTPTNAPIILAMVGVHPPLKDPKTGMVRTRDEFKVNTWIYRPYFIYSFDEEWEAIPGQWRFEVWHEGKKLCEQSFTVVRDRKPKDQK